MAKARPLRTDLGRVNRRGRAVRGRRPRAAKNDPPLPGQEVTAPPSTPLASHNLVPGRIQHVVPVLKTRRVGCWGIGEDAFAVGRASVINASPWVISCSMTIKVKLVGGNLLVSFIPSQCEIHDHRHVRSAA